jgi:hypothetical protein
MAKSTVFDDDDYPSAPHLQGDHYVLTSDGNGAPLSVVGFKANNTTVNQPKTIRRELKELRQIIEELNQKLSEKAN